MNRSYIVLTVILLGASLPLHAENWSRWRGPHNTGMANGSAPLSWSATENIKWTADVPGRGHSTPVVWGDRIFVTTAVSAEPIPQAKVARSGGQGHPGPGGPGGGMPPEVRERMRELTGGKEISELTEEERREVFEKMRAASGGGHEGARGSGRPGFGGPGGGTGAGIEHQFLVIAYDKNTGEELWRQSPITSKPHEGYHRQYGSFASNAPVTDGEHVYAFFGSRGVFAYDLAGNLQWKKESGVEMQMVMSFGEGIAPALYGDALLLVFDHEGQSFITALDKRTGKELWRQDRDEVSNWSQPLITEHNGRIEAIVAAPGKVRSYDFSTGDLIWECAGLGRNTIPAVVRDGDVVYAMSGFRDPNLLAIKLGGKGDLTDSDHVLWTNERGNSYTASPVVHDGILYFVTDRGILSAFNARTGEPYYQQQRLPNPYSIKASPVGADGKLYIATEDGDVVVIGMGPIYEALATNTIDDEFFIASPVIVDGEIFLRGRNRLYAISEND